MKKYLTVFLLMIGMGWSVYFISHEQLYPVVMVNWKVITAKVFESAFNSAFIYYNKLKKPEVDTITFEKEIRRATLDKLIENQLIYENVNGAEIDTQVASLISQNKNLDKGVPATLGLSIDSFKDLVIRPQVAVEILQKKLKENKKDYNNWLRQQKMNASVYLFVDNLKWSNGKVELK